MPDHATSTSPIVQAQLDRLWSLSPGADILGLDRITALLDLLGNPQRRLPPVFHVAGTNGKGSTCAFLRAALEAAGYKVHAYTSPHLVRFNERIRIAGRLIEDDALAVLLADVLDHAGEIGASFFEVTTAAAFLAFARSPADACIIEVGLGGRLDATNVVEPLVCGIAQLGIDHQSFLGNSAEEIAREKAGIAKPGVPLVTMDYPAHIAAVIAAAAEAVGAPVLARDRDWSSGADAKVFHYEQPGFRFDGRPPVMSGPFQAENYALAVAMLRHQTALPVADKALAAAAAHARWPARMQRLAPGPLTARVGTDRIYLDGAHNSAAARPVGDWWRKIADGEPTVLIVGLLANKDADGILQPLCDQVSATVIGVPVPGHEHHAPAAIAAIAGRHGADSTTADSIESALDLVRDRSLGRSVLIAGSLYLAGLVLASNEEIPD